MNCNQQCLVLAFFFYLTLLAVRYIPQLDPLFGTQPWKILFYTLCLFLGEYVSVCPSLCDLSQWCVNEDKCT